MNDGSLNYHLYSYVVSFWWVVSSILSPVTIGLLIFVWQYNNITELNNDIPKSKFLGIVKPLLDMLAVPASYDITILKKGPREKLENEPSKPPSNPGVRGVRKVN